MSINCDVFIRDRSTPEELKTLGNALWRWYSRSSGDEILCQSVDNQALADLLAGRVPSTRRSAHHVGQPYVSFRLRAATYADCAATFASLRSEVPAAQVSDIVVDGKSWTLPSNVQIKV